MNAPGDAAGAVPVDTPMSRAADRCLSSFAEEVGVSGPVAVEGHRSRWELGGPLAEGTRLLRAPAGVVEYHPEEMVVRVRAGTPVADLHAALAEAGQRSALPERGGTVGGAIAVGENHLCCLGRGQLRSSVLQVRYVSAEGRVVVGGGPTVKNVTGYDLPRLLVGSLGTLGLLGDVIVRTNPIPVESRWLVSPDTDPFAARDLLLRPGAVLWDGSRTWVLLEGHPGDVDCEAALLGRVGSWAPVEGPPQLPPHRWSLRPSQLRHLDGSSTGGHVASVGVGTVFAARPAPSRLVPDAVGTLEARVKAQFDPDGRLAPGRHPGRA